MLYLRTRALSLLAQFLSLLCFTESPVARQVLWDYCGLEMKEREKSRKKGNMCLGLRKRFGEDFRKKKMLEELRDGAEVDGGGRNFLKYCLVLEMFFRIVNQAK